MHGLLRRMLFFVPLLACACQAWSTVRLAPKESGALPGHSWVVLIGGARVPVEDGRFTPDSVIGTQGAGARFAVSRDSVAFVEERRVSALRTVGLIAGSYGVVLVAGAVAVLLSLSLLD